MSGEKRTKILEAGGFLTNEKDRDGKIGGEHSQNIDRGHRHREEGALGAVCGLPRHLHRQTTQGENP